MSLTSRYNRNCENCVFFKDNYCTWFEYRCMDKKLVPKDIINKGCSYWSDDDPHPLTLIVIKKMKGKLL